MNLRVQAFNDNTPALFRDSWHGATHWIRAQRKYIDLIAEHIGQETGTRLCTRFNDQNKRVEIYFDDSKKRVLVEVQFPSLMLSKTVVRTSGGPSETIRALFKDIFVPAFNFEGI